MHGDFNSKNFISVPHNPKFEKRIQLIDLEKIHVITRNSGTT